MKAKYWVRVKSGHQAQGYHWFNRAADRKAFMQRMAKRFPEWHEVVLEIK